MTPSAPTPEAVPLFWDRVPKEAKRLLPGAAYRLLGAILEFRDRPETRMEVDATGRPVFLCSDEDLAAILDCNPGTVRHLFPILEEGRWAIRSRWRGIRAVALLFELRGVTDPPPVSLDDCRGKRALLCEAPQKSARRSGQKRPPKRALLCDHPIREFSESLSKIESEEFAGEETPQRQRPETSPAELPPTPPPVAATSLNGCLDRLREKLGIPDDSTSEADPFPAPTPGPPAPAIDPGPAPDPDPVAPAPDPLDFLGTLTPAQRARFDGQPPRARARIGEWLSTGDPILRGEALKILDAAPSPPLPPPDLPAPELIDALAGPMGRALVPRCADAIREAIGDKGRSWHFWAGLCADVAAGVRPPENLREPLLRTLRELAEPRAGPIRNPPGYLARSVLNWTRENGGPS